MGTKGKGSIMTVSDASPCGCGGSNERSARTERLGDGENVILYLHYFLKCAQCGRASEDTRMRFLNAAGAASARDASAREAAGSRGAHG